MGNSKSSEVSGTANTPTRARNSEKRDTNTSAASKKGARTHRLSLSSEGSGGMSKKGLLAAGQRQIVRGCMDNARDDIAERIYRRVLEKRDDFHNFTDALSDEQRMDLAMTLREYLLGVVDHLGDSDEVQRISEQFGEYHVHFRCFGFRPDFFASTADAVTTECVFLDAAVHQAVDTLTAWSTLTSFMFSAVRDGYYNELRRQRRASNSVMNSSKGFADTSVDSDDRRTAAEPRNDDDLSFSNRSISPLGVAEETLMPDGGVQRSTSRNVSSSYLLPPQELRGY